MDYICASFQFFLKLLSVVFIEIFTIEEVVVYTEYFSIDDVTLLEIRKPNNPLGSVLDLGPSWNKISFWKYVLILHLFELVSVNIFILNLN